ncbi:MAG: hypothetical protein CMA06_00885, partial [Euryarchaeota archaeon]|nr:hypothetical protein [Euryarchaeota archaeon]
MSDEDFLILDDEDDTSTQAKPESRLASTKSNSDPNDSRGGLLSSLRGALSGGVDGIRSRIASSREKRAAAAAPVDELILDDGSMEQV